MLFHSLVFAPLNLTLLFAACICSTTDGGPEENIVGDFELCSGGVQRVLGARLYIATGVYLMQILRNYFLKLVLFRCGSLVNLNDTFQLNMDAF